MSRLLCRKERRELALDFVLEKVEAAAKRADSKVKEKQVEADLEDEQVLKV